VFRTHFGCVCVRVCMCTMKPNGRITEVKQMQSCVTTQINGRATTVNVAVIVAQVHRLTVDCGVGALRLRLPTVLPVPLVIQAVIGAVALPTRARHMQVVLLHRELCTHELPTDGPRPGFARLRHYPSINATIKVIHAIHAVANDGVVVELPAVLCRPVWCVAVLAFLQHRPVTRARHG
jgi:hypothetical protein